MCTHLIVQVYVLFLSCIQPHFFYSSVSIISSTEDQFWYVCVCVYVFVWLGKCHGTLIVYHHPQELIYLMMAFVPSETALWAARVGRQSGSHVSSLQ